MELHDQSDNVVAANTSSSKGILTVNKPKLWWPHTLAPEGSTHGYMHFLVVYTLAGTEDDYSVDVYR